VIRLLLEVEALRPPVGTERATCQKARTGKVHADALAAIGEALRMHLGLDGTGLGP
jgi:hypothetical protein